MASVIKDVDTTGYYVLPTGITISGKIKQYTNISARDNDTNPADYAVVLDATGDSTVKSGAALYAYSNNSWTKVYETESIDIEDKITWDNLVVKPSSTIDEIDNTVALTHTHANKNVLDRLSVDAANELAFDGITINTVDTTELESQIAVNSSSIDSLNTTVGIHSTQIQTLLETEVPSTYVTTINGMSGIVELTVTDLGGATVDSVEENSSRISALETTDTTLYSMITENAEVIQELVDNPVEVPITTVNGQTGDVVITLDSLDGASVTDVNNVTTTVNENTANITTILDSLTWNIEGK